MFVNGRHSDFIGITAMDGTQYTSFIIDLPSRHTHALRAVYGVAIDAEGKLMIKCFFY